jgi:pyruvate dehydrogenase E2 component (dihydrolipoamide acetyltransferase)
VCRPIYGHLNSSRGFYFELLVSKRKYLTFEKIFSIMAEVIRMPLLSDTMTEGKISVWNKQVGDKVQSDDSLADVETDKATMEVIPYVEGTLLYIGVEAGKAAKVNDIIAIIGKPGEDIQHLLPSNNAAPAAAPVQDALPVVEVAAPAIPSDVTVIRMPLLSDTMTEGKIVVWNKQVGDAVKADDALADVETDKATMEVIGYADGTLLYQGVEAGKAAKVNDIIAIVGKASTDISAFLPQLLQQGSSTPSTSSVVSDVASASTDIHTVTASSHEASSSDGRVKASPLAKSIAREKGIDLSLVHGSGDNGRIVKRDIDEYKPSAAAPASTTATPASVTVAPTPGFTEGHTDIPLTQMRKIIAQRLSESMFTAPHFYLKTSVEMDALMEARIQMNKISPVKISFNDIMIKACALALTRHPDVNSSWMGEFIRQNHHVHIGSAIALPDGLIVPVIKHANLKTLSQIAADANALYEKARTKKIQPQEFTGNTFTISNLGMMDIDEFTAIINPPDSCILAVGKIQATPVVKDGKFVIRHIMKLTLSCDHRSVDGAVGAQFLQTLKSYLENPSSMLV